MTERRRTVKTPRQRPGRSPVNMAKYAEIVEVAGHLFAEKGFAATSLQDIAIEVGVLKGSLYHYITSKEELLAEVVRVGQQGLQENLALCEHFAGEPIEELIAFTYGHVRLNATEERLQRGIVFQRDFDKLDDQGRAEAVEKRDNYDKYLRRVLLDGQDKGLIDPEAAPRVTGFLVLGVANSYMRWFKPGGPITADELGRECAGFVLAAVRNHLTSEPQKRFALVDTVVERCRTYIDEMSKQADEHVA